MGNKSRLPVVAAALAALMAGYSSANAEGGDLVINGVHGVIRIVRSNTGFASTAGHADISFYQPVNAAGGYDAQTNPLNNKPSAYLGGTAILNDNSSLEVEGGLQYETGVGVPWAPGWSAFITRSKTTGGNQYVNPHYYVPNDPLHPLNGGVSLEWRAGPPSGATGSISADMSFAIVPSGGYTMQISSLASSANGQSTFFWNPETNPGKDPRIFAGPVNGVVHWLAPWGSDNYNSANQSNALVKHEVAQTRGTSTADDFQLDGSQVTGTWTGCTINGAPWTSALTAQEKTGYNAPGGTGNITYDKIWGTYTTPPSLTIVQFTGLSVDNATARQTIGDANRYQSETTVINLGTATRPEGQAVAYP